MNRATKPITIRLERNFPSVYGLWDQAARMATINHGLQPDEIVETIGPREDPDIDACAAMIFDRIAGEDDVVHSGAAGVTTARTISPKLKQVGPASKRLLPKISSVSGSIREYFRTA